MQAWLSQYTIAEAFAKLEAVSLPGAEALTPQKAIDNEHVNAIGLLRLWNFPD